MYNTFFALLATLFLPIVAHAKFNTITKNTPVTASIVKPISQPIGNEISIASEINSMPSENTNVDVLKEVGEMIDVSHQCDNRKSPKLAVENTVRLNSDLENTLPELTIPNLITEIEKNGIRYPKIVLAQAILETGWFRSNVCRTKNNLFGLTNPRTKTYYEFDHWTDSVRAYMTKVQYRYKGGNYLLWLKKIGYAEDPGYIRAIISVLRQL